MKLFTSKADWQALVLPAGGSTWLAHDVLPVLPGLWIGLIGAWLMFGCFQNSLIYIKQVGISLICWWPGSFDDRATNRLILTMLAELTMAHAKNRLNSFVSCSVLHGWILLTGGVRLRRILTKLPWFTLTHFDGAWPASPSSSEHSKILSSLSTLSLVLIYSNTLGIDK